MVLRRFLRVCFAFLRVLPALWRGSPDRGARLAAAVAGLGGVWIKAGQLMSARRDRIPGDVADELAGLRGTLPGRGGSFGRDVVTAELGSLDAFADFDDTPVAAASIGQVHRARLVSGKAVAVKIIHPDAPASYAADLAVLRWLARWCGWVFPKASLRDMADELTAVIMEELDLRYEASHVQTMRPMLWKHGILVPKVRMSLCTSRVMVCDWVDGQTLDAIFRLGPQAQTEAIVAQGLTPRCVGRRLLDSMFSQVLEENRFHGDMHPGNLIIGQRVAVIDFGATHATEFDFLSRYVAFITALTRRNYFRAADLFCLLCYWRPLKGHRKALDWLWGRDRYGMLRRRLMRAMQAWVERTDVRALPFHQRSIGALSEDLMRVVLDSRGSLQWAWFRLTRAWAAIEGTLGVLWPSVNYMRETGRFFREMNARAVFRPPSLASLMAQVARLLDRYDEWSQIEGASVRLAGITEGS